MMQQFPVRSELKFLLGSEPVHLRDVDPTRTVLDFLRLERRLTGSKEGCAEGDCGACTVLVGRPDAHSGLRYEAVNGCIRFLASLDGCQLIAIEHLRAPDGGLHPVQQAMLDCHGSQCGFCTPGFVMSLAALWLNADSASEADIETALQGNLCRCTGYRPIVAAGLRMFELGRRADDPLVQASASAAESLRALAGAGSDADRLEFSSGERRFIAPGELDDLAAILAGAAREGPLPRIVAGATDVGLWVTKGLQRIDTVVWLGRIAQLRQIEERPEGLRIGAMATYSDAWPVLERAFPPLGELFHRVGGAQVRNMGTIGGNIANGSPIGDMAPALIALDARLELRLADTRREIALEDYFIEYGRQDLQPGEFIEAIVVPRLQPQAHFRVYKISKRREEDISTLLAAIRVDRDEDGMIAGARIAFGGMAGTPKRAPGAEAALVGKPWSAATLEQAARAVPDDFTPLSDWRASAGYRSRVAGNLMRRFWLEEGGVEVEARLAATMPGGGQAGIATALPSAGTSPSADGSHA